MCNHGPLFTAIGACFLVLMIAASDATAQDPLENAPLAPGSRDKDKASEKGTAGSTNKAGARAQTDIKPEFIVKTPAEWRKILTRMQFAVARQKMTEQAFAGKYASGHFRGTFVCVCCAAAHVESELFSSRTKFESGTGWPSFYQAYSNKALQTAWDYSDGEPRLEVMCRRCGAHLGHVFDDGPPPTGLRFCINSASIKLISPEADMSLRSAAGKTSSKAKSKARAKKGRKNSAPKPPPSGEPTDSTGAAAAPAADKAAGDSPRPTSGL